MTNASEADRGTLPTEKGSPRALVSVRLAAVLAFTLLIGAGIAYRVIESGLPDIWNNPITLPMPLSKVPMRIDPWTGEDVELATTTREYIKSRFGDDYVNRRYMNEEGLRADVYIVYCSSYPSGLLGHRPGVCFPANGYIQEGTAKTQIETRSGQLIECLSQQFHKDGQRVSVLSFYVLNGVPTAEERDFSGILGRLPNISGNPARYVAQVQISAGSEEVTKRAARDLVDKILTYLPDAQGCQQAAASLTQEDAGLGGGADR
jgi:hypothetical protein